MHLLTSLSFFSSRQDAKNRTKKPPFSRNPHLIPLFSDTLSECILQSIDPRDPMSAEKLLPLVYDELRMLARQKMAREKPGQTLQATALVHEAYFRLIGPEGKEWDGRAHFFGAAAEAMRRILIDRARRKIAQRRGAGAPHVNVDFVDPPDPASDEQLLAVHEALARFAMVEPQQAELVKLRYFVGMSIEETASILGISEATVKRWWSYARAWLFDAIRSEQ